MKKYLFTLFVLFLASISQAQSSAPEMADPLRANGKIYVVVCVAAIVMLGLIIYLITIDRKISKIEQDLKSRKKVS
jgi:hypothetical protein